MDKRRSGIPGPSSAIGGMPKRAPSPSSAAFTSAGGPLGGYRPASREGNHRDPSTSTAGRFGFASNSGGNGASTTSSLSKGTPMATRVAVQPSTASKRSISNADLATPNGGANKRPFLTSGSARTSLASSSATTIKDNSAMDAEYKREELLSQQAYGRLQQDLNAKGRELDKEKEERAGLLRQWEALNEEILQERKQNSQHRKALQERVNELQSRNNDLTAHIDEADSERAKALQQAQSIKTTLSIRVAELEAEVATASTELEAQEHARQRAEAELKTQEDDWQKEKQRLQSSRGDDAESAKLTEELHKLLSKIRKLESDNLSLSHENKQLQSRKDSIEALKEQNRNLENKVGVMAELRRRLAEAESKSADLEAEKQHWQTMVKAGRDTSAYQDAYATCSDTETKVAEIEEPDEISLQTIGPYLARLQGAHAGLLVRGEALSNRVDHLRKECLSLEESKAAEIEQGEKLKLSLEESKMAKMKSEKSRETIAMEMESYKRLLETYQTEAQNLSAQYDGASAEQILLLQGQLDARTAELNSTMVELQEAQEKLSTLNATGNISADEKNRLERQHEEREKELLKSIQESKQTYDELEKQCVSLGKANDDLFARLGRGEFDQTKLRVLEMKDNPVSRDRVIRTTMLDGLKKENAQLLEQIRELNERISQHQISSNDQQDGPNSSLILTEGGVVPAQSLENMREDYAKLQEQMRARDKAFDRLKEAFGAKATEYVAAVKALFGYDMHVLSRGKVKLRSVYARTSKGTSLTFDAGEQDDIANMRLVGEARQGAANVANLKRYWLNADRCSVPCFLAALQLELYESTTQAARQGWAEGDEEE